MKIALTTFMFFLTGVAHAVDFDFKAETKLNYRDSESNRFGVKFPFPPIALPIGQTQAFVETPDAGSHAEISDVSLFWDVDFESSWAVKAKVDIFDRYEKNPTSTDLPVSLDQFIIRYGTRHTQGELPHDTDGYIQVGKFSKFERQEDRHLESYGLSGTAFNRVEDSGFEAGVDFSSGIYAKLSYTTGNPVFIRDVNALAGDNGTDRTPPPNNDPEIKTGIPILYDAEIESFDLSKNPEKGGGLGYRWLNEDGSQRINFLLYTYKRNLAETIKLHGTFYGGDLDILDVSEVIPGVRLPIKNNKKKESGMNFWWYTQNFSLFSQLVYQDIAGLKRDGWEVELSYALQVPDVMGMTQISPVFRYSKLNNHFVGEPRFPAPSVWWNWQKYDVGFNTDFGENIRLTMEYNINKFIRNKRTEGNNEFLLTLRLRYD